MTKIGGDNMFSADELTIQLHKLAYLKLLKMLKKVNVKVDNCRLPARNISTRLVSPKVKALFEAVLGKERYSISKIRGAFCWYVSAIEDINDNYDYQFDNYFTDHVRTKEIRDKYNLSSYSWYRVTVFDGRNENMEFNSSVLGILMKFKKYTEEIIELKKQLYAEWQKTKERKAEIVKNTLQRKYNAVVSRKLAVQGGG